MIILIWSSPERVENTSMEENLMGVISESEETWERWWKNRTEIVQGGVQGNGLREEYGYIKGRDGTVDFRKDEWRENWRSKVTGKNESWSNNWRGHWNSTNEGFCGFPKNKFDMFLDRHIQRTRFISFKAMVAYKIFSLLWTAEKVWLNQEFVYCKERKRVEWMSSCQKGSHQ